MARKETIDKIERIIVLLFKICKDHVVLKAKSGALSNHPGRFFLLERNSFQVLLDDPNVRLKTGKEVRITSEVTDMGTLELTATAVGFGTVRTAQRNIKKIVHVLDLPKSITITDRREEQRYKIPMKDNIYVYFDMSRVSQKNANGENGNKKGESGRGKASIVPVQLVDVSRGGLRSFPPRDKNRMRQLREAEPPLPAVIEFPNLEVNLKLSLANEKQSKPGAPKYLRFAYHGSNEAAIGQIMKYIESRARENEEKELKRITVMLNRQSRIVNPQTLKSEMTEEELDRIKWRRKDDTFFVQTDKLVKGEAAFHVYVPKKGQDGVWVLRRR